MTWYEEGQSLNLDLFVQAYEDSRGEYWGEDEEGRRRLELIDQFAKTLLSGSLELVQPRAEANLSVFTWDQIAAMAGLDPIADQIKERIEIDVAWEYSVDTQGMAQRCLELMQLVIKAEPSEAVMRYTRRLSRCYIAGFGPECVMLCRAVLENALKEKYRRKEIPFPATPKGGSPMRGRIDSAARFRWLSADAAGDAWVIWKRGSKAVHEDPTATTDVLGTIGMTMGVIGELYAD